MNICQKCKGISGYMYDRNHGKICEVCYKRDYGYWQLKEHYGENNDKWCFKAGSGCGHVENDKPKESV